MRVLVLVAHPHAEGFAHAVRASAVAGLSRAGHKVRVLDLHREGFDPVMSHDERQRYHTPGANETRVADQLELLRWAEGLIFVYPTWWYSLPAMLKGWMDRVLVPFATFDLPKGLRPIRGKLDNIRVIGGFSTYGSPSWWIHLVVGDLGRAIIMRGLRPLCHRRCQTFWLGHYRMDSSTPKSRKAVLARVEALAASLS